MVKRADGDRAAATAAAQAEAEQVRLHGEAEAAAHEMRAEAYRHFNDAAILATILRDLPAIVNAAAEPIGKIDNLTVLSTDGASELVRTATTNLTQAGHAIKGLTGIDIPEVFTGALDAAGISGRDATTALSPREVAPEAAGSAAPQVEAQTDGIEASPSTANDAASEDEPTSKRRRGRQATSDA